MAESYYASKGFVTEAEAERFMRWTSIGVAKKHPEERGRFDGPWISRRNDRIRVDDHNVWVPVAVQAFVYCGSTITEASEKVANTSLWKERVRACGRGRKRRVHPGEKVNKDEPWRQAETIRNLYQKKKKSTSINWENRLKWGIHLTQVAPTSCGRR